MEATRHPMRAQVRERGRCRNLECVSFLFERSHLRFECKDSSIAFLDALVVLTLLEGTLLCMGRRVYVQIRCVSLLSGQLPLGLQLLLVLLLLQLKPRFRERDHLCQGPLVAGVLGELCTHFMQLETHREIGLPLLTKRQREGVELF